MDKAYDSRQAAEFLGVKVKTLQKWDREDKLKPASRSKTKRRIYTENRLKDFLRLKSENSRVRVVAYCRVSSQAQKPDLRKQQTVIEQYCGELGLRDVEFICEKELSPEQEMIQDLMTIVHRFSSRLCGLRDYKKSLKEALEHDSSLQNRNRSSV
ncbi:MAG: MerR family transcriptional regulator [Synergistaceae bacterium]|nr:MerR family transcriptional regulator [Synergistaceae bacterium]